MTVQYHGVTLDLSSKLKLEIVEAMMGFPLQLPQGSYSTSVSASAGTHAGGGAVDVHCSSYDTATKIRLVYWLRSVGFAAWHRVPPLFVEHIHCVEIGNPHVSPAAAGQLVQWSHGLNGLADHGPDDNSVDVHAGRPPLYVPPKEMEMPSGEVKPGNDKSKDTTYVPLFGQNLGAVGGVWLRFLADFVDTAPTPPKLRVAIFGPNGPRVEHYTIKTGLNIVPVKDGDQFASVLREGGPLDFPVGWEVIVKGK